MCTVHCSVHYICMADESMTKQRCTIIQIQLWDICFYLCDNMISHIPVQEATDHLDPQQHCSLMGPGIRRIRLMMVMLLHSTTLLSSSSLIPVSLTLASLVTQSTVGMSCPTLPSISFSKQVMLKLTWFSLTVLCSCAVIWSHKTRKMPSPRSTKVSS